MAVNAAACIDHLIDAEIGVELGHQDESLQTAQGRGASASDAVPSGYPPV
jgi:hypothetical protein